MELSFSLQYAGAERVRELILQHPPEYLLFGSDSPWADQSDYLSAFRALNLDEALTQRILCENAARLLGLA